MAGLLQSSGLQQLPQPSPPPGRGSSLSWQFNFSFWKKSQNLFFKVSNPVPRSGHTSLSSHVSKPPAKLRYYPSTNTEQQFLPGSSCLCLFQLRTNIEQMCSCSLGTRNILCCSPAGSDMPRATVGQVVIGFALLSQEEQQQGQPPSEFPALATSQRIARHSISWYIKPYSSREFPSEGNSASPGDIWQDLGTFFAATV